MLDNQQGSGGNELQQRQQQGPNLYNSQLDITNEMSSKMSMWWQYVPQFLVQAIQNLLGWWGNRNQWSSVTWWLVMGFGFLFISTSALRILAYCCRYLAKNPRLKGQRLVFTMTASQYFISPHCLTLFAPTIIALGPTKQHIYLSLAQVSCWWHRWIRASHSEPVTAQVLMRNQPSNVLIHKLVCAHNSLSFVLPNWSSQSQQVAKFIDGGAREPVMLTVALDDFCFTGNNQLYVSMATKIAALASWLTSLSKLLTSLKQTGLQATLIAPGSPLGDIIKTVISKSGNIPQIAAAGIVSVMGYPPSLVSSVLQCLTAEHKNKDEVTEKLHLLFQQHQHFMLERQVQAIQQAAITNIPPLQVAKGT
jgi:hypothetical protein